MAKERYTIEITGGGSGGIGVGHIDGKTILIPFGVIGDVLEIHLTKIKAKYAWGAIDRIIAPSPARNEDPPCDRFDRCGGCDTIHMHYPMQLQMKEREVKDCLHSIAKLHPPIGPIIGANRTTHYRNKVQLPVGQDKNGEIITGFYAPKSHRIVEHDDCCIEPKGTDVIAKTLVQYMRDYGLKPYDEQQHTGTIRHLCIRNDQYNKKMVIIVTNRPLPDTDALVQRLREASPNIISIYVNYNRDKTNVIMGRDFFKLFGQKHLTYQIFDLHFHVSPESFLQIHTGQIEALYASALDMAAITKEDTVLDIYCGIGTITLCAAGRAKEVIGIEIVESAVKNAKNNARINGIENASFYAGDAAKITQQLKQQGRKPDIILLDPPRKGCDEKMLQLLAELAPKRIVYVSCNPATLARDVLFLTQNGYDLAQVQPVDLFPHTSHVETVVKLSLKKDTPKIETGNI